MQIILTKEEYDDLVAKANVDQQRVAMIVKEQMAERWKKIAERLKEHLPKNMDARILMSSEQHMMAVVCGHVREIIAEEINREPGGETKP